MILGIQLFYDVLFRYEKDQNVRTPPGKGSGVPAMGLGLAPMPGGGHQRTRHRSYALCRLSGVALVRFVNVPGRPSRCADQRLHELQGVQKVQLASEWTSARLR
jgi:hypothetical protein